MKGKRFAHKKYSVSSIVLFGLFGAFLFASYDDKTELSPTEFMNMLETNAFKEVSFIEEEYFLTKKTKVRKVEGKINNQTFFAYVLSFEPVLKIVIGNP